MHAKEEKIWLVKGNGMGKVLLVYRWDQSGGALISPSLGQHAISSILGLPSCYYYIVCSNSFSILEIIVCNTIERIVDV